MTAPRFTYVRGPRSPTVHLVPLGGRVYTLCGRQPPQTTGWLPTSGDPTCAKCLREADHGRLDRWPAP